METFVVALQLALAIVLGVAAVGKFMDLPGARKAVREFGVPDRFAHAGGTALPVVELVLALLLLFGPTVRWGAFASGLLFLLFIAAIGWNLRQGRQPDCHCFGQIHSEPAGISTLVRNALLFLAAGIVAGEGGHGLSGWFADLSEAARVGVELGVLIVGATVAQFWFMQGLRRQSNVLLDRLDSLESTMARVGSSNGADPEPQVTEAPAFDIPDLEGGRLTLSSLLRPEQSLLLLFTDPYCGPCNALMPDMVEWKRRFGTELEIAFVSRGNVDANHEKFVGDFDGSRIGLQEKFEVSERFGVQGTPSAVLVRPDGMIHDRPAVGRDDIRALVTRATTNLSPEAQRRLEENAANLSLDFEPDNPLQHLPVSLHIGEPAPRTPLPDLNGEYVSVEDRRGRPTVVLFWNPECTFCERMLPDLKEWEQEAGALDGTALVISRGTVGENREQGLRSRVVIDDGFTAGGWVGVSGTPSAVRIDAKGRIASPVVLGADAILDLLYEHTHPETTEGGLAVTMS